MWQFKCLLLAFGVVAVGPAPSARAGVVVNEIFYNAPNDLDDLQWIEIHNTAGEAVDLGGWTLDDGKVFTFPAKTMLAGNGYLVVALSTDRFAKICGFTALGPFQRPLKRGGEKLVLKDALGKVADTARYKDRAPWPASADGESASLERICPTSSGDTPDNWAASPLPATPKPAGTPGKPNANFSATLPPLIEMTAAPTDLPPSQPLRVEADVRGAAKEIALLYRVFVGGLEGKERSLPMAKDAGGRFAASIPGQAAGTLVRYRVKAVGNDGAVRHCPGENDLRPALSAYVHDKFESAKIPLGFVLLGGPDRPAEGKGPARPPFAPPGGAGGAGGRGPRPNFAGFGPRQEVPKPTRGSSAFVFVDSKTGKAQVFDFINSVPRGSDRGFKIFFHKDHRLNGLSSVNLAFEGSEWSLLAEALAYDVYHKAGSPAPLTEFVRVWVDGKLSGHHLLIERPGKSFLRRNEIDDSGNLYKVLWTGRGVVGQHEKRTNKQTGHDDLVAVVDELAKTKGDVDKQWKVIQEQFDVDQVATYFAVNAVLSHWDGFFNNHFAYRDPKRGKWILVPWDQDKTSGYYDGLPDDKVFFDMPLTFGMEGDRPPAGAGFRANWWRPGGHFSGPLLANPHFRKVYLARTRELLDKIYTKDTVFPLVDAMTKRLGDDAALRAKLRGEPEAAGAKLLARDAELLKTHLVKRREFLLAQKEIPEGRR